MCGIAGLIRPRGAGPDLASTLGAMTAALTHRGPDHGGLWTDPAAGAGLGHRRLAIIDLSPGGRQPIVSASGRYVLTYNGEIYNFRELRHTLEGCGVRFRGASDSEVLLAAIEQWGLERALGRSAGMFAFALWDRERRALTLARDHLGIKPLYWSLERQELAFASELRALYARPYWTPVIDRGALAAYARWNYVPTPHAIFEGVRKLRPGHLLTFDRAGRLEERPFWRLVDVVEAGAERRRAGAEDGIEELRATLDQVIREQMLADVPLGALLSGGVDSSLVSALTQAYGGRPLKTFTIGYAEPAFDEAPYARAVAAHLGTDHHELTLGPGEARAVIPELATIYDEPFADSSQIPSVLVARFARRQVKVCLVGDGGDELFAGYERYHWAARVRRWPRPLRGALAAALLGLSPAPWQRSGEGRSGERIAKLARLLAAADETTAYAAQHRQWPDPAALVPGAREPADLPWCAAFAPGAADFIERQQLADMLMYLPDDLLTKVDRATMAVGLEARVPLLDHRLVECVWRLPPAARHRRGTTKVLLRQLLYERVPAALVERPKRGFRVPLTAWLRGPLRAWADDLLADARLRRDGLFEPAVVGRAWADFRAGRGGLQEALWGVLMFQSWHAATGAAVHQPQAGRQSAPFEQRLAG
jgi:asparagine synthase (glutamine-hydrolysing)